MNLSRVTSREQLAGTMFGPYANRAGRLLTAAIEAGFEVFVTADQNLEYQQNLARIGAGIIVVAAKSNRIGDLLPLIPSILEALLEIQPGQVRRVGA